MPLLTGEAAALAITPGRPHEQTLFVSPEGPGLSISLRPRERVARLFSRGTSFVTVLEQQDEGTERWVAGKIPERAGEAAPLPIEVDAWRADTVMDEEGRKLQNAPLALSSDGGWLLEIHGRQGTIHGMGTGERFLLPAACAGWLRFFDFEPVARRFHVAVSSDPRTFLGEVRHCETDRTGRLATVRKLRPLKDTPCSGGTHTCSVTLDQVWLGGLVLSVHEETGMGALGSVLLDARSGREIPLSNYEARADRIEGFAPASRPVFVTVRNVGGRLVRTEERVDHAFQERWEKEREPRPQPQFAYCIVSGVPIPAALCPPEEAFRAGG